MRDDAFLLAMVLSNLICPVCGSANSQSAPTLVVTTGQGLRFVSVGPNSLFATQPRE
jgi:formate dehydrogenase maturation protein FdhE